MQSSFEFIKRVNDQHFCRNLSHLYTKCVNIERLVNQPTGLDEAVALMRVQNEVIIRYFFERLVAKADRIWTAYSALRNPVFKAKIGNNIYIKTADQIRILGNDTIHPHMDSKFTKEEVETLFWLFVNVVKTACQIVDRLPPVAEKGSKKISGKVLLSIRKEQHSDGSVKRYLVAEVMECDFDSKKLFFVWKNKKGIVLQREHSNQYLLPEKPDNAQYTCVVNADNVKGSVRYDGWFTDHSKRKNREKPREAAKTNILDKFSEASHTPAEACPYSDKKPQRLSRKDNGSKLEFTPINIVTVPMKWSAVIPKLFDSTSGLTHYFVCPNDNIVLNSLEMLDEDAYLYRLLKQENYDNIVFVGIESTYCWLYTYDTQSEAAFQGETAKQGSREPAASSAFGRRHIRTFSWGEEFIKQFATEIGQALSSPVQKTAVVMPIGIFGRNAFCGEAVIDTLNEIERNGNYGNILLLTMPRREDFLECFEGSQFRLHSSWASFVRNSMRTENINIVQESIRHLKEQGLIVLADEYQPDEIANLLLRKKIIHRLPAFNNLPASKIYALAELLYAHCMQIRHEFKSIPYIKRKGHCIRQLNSLLDVQEVQQEILAHVKKVESVCIGYSNQVQPLYVERVYHQNIARYENRNAETKFLQEFDFFVGREMQSVKESILSAVRVLKDGQQHLRQEENAGRAVKKDDMPYMNFRFVGPIGTGKTSAARITARYLNAGGILPESKIVTVNAEQMVCSRVRDTIKLLQEAADRADGGVLIIDEFQEFDSACQDGNLAKEAMRTIVQIINRKKTSLCIIAVGYESGIKHIFDSVSNAARRFPHTIRFQNYSVDSLMEILDSILKKRGRRIAPEAIPLIRHVIESDMAAFGSGFGNAGYVKDILIPTLTGSLLKHTKDQNIFTAGDVLNAFPEKNKLLESNQEQKTVYSEEGNSADVHAQTAYTKLPRMIFENLPPPFPEGRLGIKKLGRLSDKAILHINADQEEGTAFLIHPDGYAVTCSHVINGAKQIHAAMGGEQYSCRVVNSKPEYDIALIQIVAKYSNQTFPYLALSKRSLEKDDKILLCGYPFGKKLAADISHNPGTISSVQSEETGVQYYTLALQAKSGHSGSPIIALSDGTAGGVLLGSTMLSLPGGREQEIDCARPIKYFWLEFLE